VDKEIKNPKERLKTDAERRRWVSGGVKGVWERPLPGPKTGIRKKDSQSCKSDGLPQFLEIVMQDNISRNNEQGRTALLVLDQTHSVTDKAKKGPQLPESKLPWVTTYRKSPENSEDLLRMRSGGKKKVKQ